jgi:hypothetical protein
MTKIFVNGLWLGGIELEPTEVPMDVVAKNKSIDAIRLYPFTYPYRSAPAKTPYSYTATPEE